MKKITVTTKMGSCRCGDYVTDVISVSGYNIAFVNWSYYDGCRNSGYGHALAVVEVLKDAGTFRLPGWETFNPDLNSKLWEHAVSSAAKAGPFNNTFFGEFNKAFPTIDVGYPHKLLLDMPYIAVFRCGLDK